MPAGDSLSLAEQGVPTAGNSLRILEFRGRLTFGDEGERRYAELRDYVQQGARTFILDLSRVPDVDSAGIGFLVSCLSTVSRANGELRLAAPSNRVLYVLLITRLDTVFPIFETVEEALANVAAH